MELRFALADTDKKLETLLGTYLAPLLLKLESSSESVREKVVKVCQHLGVRVKPKYGVFLLLLTSACTCLPFMSWLCISILLAAVSCLGVSHFVPYVICVVCGTLSVSNIFNFQIYQAPSCCSPETAQRARWNSLTALRYALHSAGT